MNRSKLKAGSNKRSRAGSVRAHVTPAAGEEAAFVPLRPVPALHPPRPQRRYGNSVHSNSRCAEEFEEPADFFGLDDEFNGYAVRLPRIPRAGPSVDEQWHKSHSDIESQYFDHLEDAQQLNVRLLQERAKLWPVPPVGCADCRVHKQRVLVIALEGAFIANASVRKCNGYATAQSVRL